MYLCSSLFRFCDKNKSNEKGRIPSEEADLNFRDAKKFYRTPINKNTLIFETTGFCHSVILINVQTDEVVYETIVTESTTQISLPAYLEGEYEIRFNSDSYCYYGIILL